MFTNKSDKLFKTVVFASQTADTFFFAVVHITNTIVMILFFILKPVWTYSVQLQKISMPSPRRVIGNSEGGSFKS